MIKTKGYYFGEYKILFDKYFGADFSKRCFVFPGQGAAFTGMFKDEYFKFKEFKEKFLLADSFAEKFNIPKISDYILRPERLEKKFIPIIANLALFTIESALFKILISQKIIPKVITGHSFGEYAAIVSSGIMSFEEMFDIIYHRDYFCPSANSLGFMIAVGVDVENLKKILGKEKYHISNFNSLRQTVISVVKNDVDNFEKILKEKNIKYKILYNIPQPYHSPHLNEVKDKMRQYLKNKKIHYKKPLIPLFSSVLKKKINKNNFKKSDIENILINQIIEPVDFISQIKSIYKLKCFNFLEIGNKKFFSFFIEDILADKDIKTELASDFLKQNEKKSIRTANFDNPERKRIFSLINKIIGKITDYEIEKISIEDKFQEDLGIDSIKKADILLRVIKEEKIEVGNNFNTSEFSTIKDTVDYIEKRNKNISFVGFKTENSKKTNFQRYILSLVKKPLENYFLRNLDYNSANYFIFSITDIFDNKNDLLRKILSFINKKERSNIIIRVNDGDFNIGKIISVFKFFREFAKTAKKDNFNLLLFSFDGLSGSQNSQIRYLVSFLKSFKKEMPGMFFKNIHFDTINGGKGVIDIILQEARDFSNTDIFYKNKERFVMQPKIIGTEKVRKKISNLSEKSVVLAIGGAKGITFSLIKNISRKYKATIYLIGRSAIDDKIVSANIAELKKENQKIYYESLDACDVEQLDKFFLKIKSKYKNIDLVINGAGVVKVGLLKDKTDEDIDYEFNNKVLPALNILKLSLKYKPKRIINFSSIISQYGNAGQTVYTAANALINELTEEYGIFFNKTGSSAVAVNFPAWDKKGMTGNELIFQKLKEQGVSFLSPKKADELFLLDIFSLNGKSVYYLDDFDDYFYRFSLNPLKRYSLIIGELSDGVNISASKIIFKKEFDLPKDVYLKDHKVGGLSYVPAAVGITMFLCFGNIYFKKITVLKGVKIQNPIIVKDKAVKCFLRVEKKYNYFNFVVESNIPHFYGRAEIKKSRKISRFDLIKTGEIIVKDLIYSNFDSKNNLYLGLVFRSIDKAIIGKNGNYSFSIDNSKLLPVFGFGFFDKLVQWIDAMFQSLGVVAMRKRGFKMLPVEIGEFYFHPETKISDFVYAMPLKIKFTKEGAMGDIVLVNKNGECIIELKSVIFKKYG